jgi:hypothetical protein
VSSFSTLFLQESLEPSLVPHVIEELLGRELVVASPSTEDIPSPPTVGSKVAVVRAPSEAHILLSLSQNQDPETRSPPIQVAMTHWIRDESCHGKVALLAASRPIRLVAKSHGGTTSSRLVAPCHRLPCMKLLRQHLEHHWSCSLHHLHGGATSPASPDPCFGVLGGLLRSA